MYISIQEIPCWAHRNENKWTSTKTQTQTPRVQTHLSKVQKHVSRLHTHLLNNRPLRNFPAVWKETAETNMWMKCHRKEEKEVVTVWRCLLWGFLLSTGKREDLDSYQSCRVRPASVTQEEQALPCGNTMLPDILLFACNDLRTHT